MATFHLGRFELAQQSVGKQASIKIQAASLSVEECPAITWEDFQVSLALIPDLGEKEVFDWPDVRMSLYYRDV